MADALQVRLVLHRADVTDPGELLSVVRRWPPRWRDDFFEREAIMAVQARFPWAVAIREAFKDCLVVARASGETLADIEASG